MPAPSAFEARPVRVPSRRPTSCSTHDRRVADGGAVAGADALLEQRLRPVQGEDDGALVGGLDLVGAGQEAGQLRGWSQPQGEEAVERFLDRRGIAGRAVLEPEPLAQGEGPGAAVVVGRPRLGQHSLELVGAGTGVADRAVRRSLPTTSAERSSKADWGSRSIGETARAIVKVSGSWAKVDRRSPPIPRATRLAAAPPRIWRRENGTNGQRSIGDVSFSAHAARARNREQERQRRPARWMRTISSRSYG